MSQERPMAMDLYKGSEKVSKDKNLKIAVVHLVEKFCQW